VHVTALDRMTRPFATMLLVAGAILATPAFAQQTAEATRSAEEELAKKLATRSLR
jgi:hypothetical protein